MLGAVLRGGLAVFAWQRLIVHSNPPLREPDLLEQEDPEALPVAQLAA